jgi:hypothetical protein
MVKIDQIFANWRESTVLSPMHLRSFAIGECPVGESLIGEIREPRRFGDLIEQYLFL